jgi:hypothetical protein
MNDKARIVMAFKNLTSNLNFVTVNSIGTVHGWANKPVLLKGKREFGFLQSHEDAVFLALLMDRVEYHFEKIYSADVSGMNELLKDLKENRSL